MRVRAALIVALLLLFPAVATAAVFDARAGAPITLVAAEGEAFADTQGRVTIADVLDGRAPTFVHLSAFPQQPDASAPKITWIRLCVDLSATQTPWALRFPYPVAQLDLYVPTPGGVIHKGAGNDLGPRHEGLTPNALLLPDATLHGATTYLRVASTADPRYAVVAVPVQTAVGYALDRRAIAGFLVGFFIAIAAFNLFLFASLRDRGLLNYAGVMLLYAMRALLTFGSIWQLLPPFTFRQREIVFDLVALAAQVALAAFTVAFLKLGRDRVAVLVVWAGVALQLTVFAIGAFHNATLAYAWTFAVTMLYYAALAFAGVRAPVRRTSVGPLFTAGAIVAAIGFAINMLALYLPRPDLAVFALYIGVSIQAVLVALAVSRNVEESRAEHERLLAISRQLEELALRDGLTGVFNRRAFDARLAAEAADAASRRAPLGILLVDIDRFKIYNDTLGHQAGDDALRLVALACASCVRSRDVFARYGGEEFAAIVPEATLDDLRAIAERMRSAVAAIGLRHVSDAIVTVSVGGASATIRQPQDAHNLIGEADAALYLAKNAGRDRVVLA